MARNPDPAELKSFPGGWRQPEFDIDQPGREFNAGGLWLLVSCNATDLKPWHASIFYGGDVDAVWTKDGFPNAAKARAVCVNKALRMLREARDAVQRADGR